MSIHGTSQSAIRPISEEAGVFELTRNFHSGWALRSTVVRLDGGALVVYSPAGRLGDAVHEEVASLGEVRFLIAANRFHYLGMREWMGRYPGAAMIATEGAAARIRRKAGIAAGPVDELRAALPGRVTLLEPEGVKNGEVWLAVRAGDESILAAGDAFFSLPGPFRGWSGALLRTLRTGPGLSVPRTWRWLHCAHPGAFHGWLEETLRAAAPTVLAPCHGEIVRDAGLGARLVALHRR